MRSQRPDEISSTILLLCLHEFNGNLGRHAIRSTWHVNEERIRGGQR